MQSHSFPIHGRGASTNPGNRFERLQYEPADERYEGEEQPHPATQYFRDSSRSIIAHNDSPDVGFSASINPYRGCEHGCVYCYARPTHEYLGMSAGLDFESMIMVKEEAPMLLRRELAAKSWKPQVLGLSGVTDCYQPIERRLQLTRQCLTVLQECRNPVVVVTKSQLAARDVDVLGRLAQSKAAAVFLSVTTLDTDLARKLEPRATQPAGRLRTISTLAAAGIPVGVFVAPVIPGLTDHELPAILDAAAAAGAKYAGYILLRLPYAVSGLFDQWLLQHYPDKREKVFARIRDIRGGRLNDPRFKTRMTGEGPIAEAIRKLFYLARRKTGIHGRGPELSTAGFRPPGNSRTLFTELENSE